MSSAPKETSVSKNPEPGDGFRLADCGAAVCCGGLSRRMGVDKALFLVKQDGRRLLAALAGELAARFGQVVLVADDCAKLAGYDELRRFAQTADLTPRQGPAGAILTALTFFPDRPVFVMACDMPVIDWSVVESLGELMAAGAEAAVPRSGERLEPLFSFYGPAAAPVFARNLKEGRLAVRESLARLRTSFLDFLDCRAETSGLFANLNCRDDVRRAGLLLLEPNANTPADRRRDASFRRD